MATRKTLKIVTILGTTRPGNFTSKALALVTDELATHDHVEVVSVDPAVLDLSFPGHPRESDQGGWLREQVSAATGVVIATPEYHGTFSAVTKLVIENLGFPSVLSGKPVALLGVAAGRIGAIKSLEQLRCVCSHTGAIVLPGPVSVAGVQQVFDADGRCSDDQVEKQIRGLATHLVNYIADNVCPRVALEALVRGGLG